MPASNALQTALYSLLSGVSGVQSVIDAPNTTPSDGDFPFIEIGSVQALANDTSGTGSGDTGVDEFVDVHVWSRYEGQKEVKTIMDAVYAALHHQTLTVTGRSTAFCWFDVSRVVPDPDGKTRQGILTFKITHRS